MPPMVYYNCSKGEGASPAPKKVFEKLKKPLDKLHRLCYNKDTVKERKVKREVKKSFKTLKKVLDKPPDLWYNTYRKTRTV